jgi:hypothetical protein
VRFEVFAAGVEDSFRAVFPKNVCSRDSFWLRKITTDPHILAHINVQRVRMVGVQNYVWELISDTYGHVPAP